MNNIRLAAYASALLAIGVMHAESPLYLTKIINQTDDTLFKIWVPNEQYAMYIFPKSTAELGQWLNLSVQKSLVIAPQKGSGTQTIFLEYGPEPSAQCTRGLMPHAIVYWQGSQSTLSSDKQYQAYCQEGKNPDLDLVIKPDLSIEVVPGTNVTKLNEC